MIDLVRRGIEWLGLQRARFAAGVVTYSRGERAVNIAATIGATTHETVTEQGAVLQVETRDYLILVADLQRLAGYDTTPAAGDQVREQVGSTTYVYEVLPLPGKRPYEYDRFHATFRIHTKLVATE